MKCNICDKNETDSTSGICWECINKTYIKPLIDKPFDMGEGHTEFVSPKELEGTRAIDLGLAVLDETKYFVDYLGIIRKLP